jgi:branched-chain amino acid transport system permease protein
LQGENGVSFLVAQSLVNGVVLGMLYMLMAIGFTLVFGIMRIVNFAHGEFYMIGAFTTFVGVTMLDLPFPVALALALVCAIFLGALAERFIFRSFRSNELSGMIASLGLAMILQNAVLILFGPDPNAMPSLASGVYRLGTLVVPKSRGMILLAAVIILGGFYLFLMHSRHGRALRALVMDPEMASAFGVRTSLLYPLGMGLGVGLAALAGGLMAPVFGVSPFIGATPLLKAFIVVIVGGLGSIPGAALAAILLGLTESFMSSFVSASSADILTFILVILVLLIRPSGLLGRGEA